MNGCPPLFVAARPLCAASLALAVMGVGASAAAAQPPSATGQAIAAAERPAPYPTFAEVPPLPTDVRPLQAWKAAILDTQAVGAQTMGQASSTPWTLDDSQGWADRGRAEAAPPPPMTTPGDLDTEAFVAAMRARATPPPRSR
jgi:hypothetical protein